MSDEVDDQLEPPTAEELQAALLALLVSDRRRVKDREYLAEEKEALSDGAAM